jgi:hypothetical protein
MARWMISAFWRDKFQTQRGQLYTLEAFLGLLIIAGVITLLMSGLVIPSTAVESDESRENEKIKQSMETVLAQARTDGSLSAALLGWDTVEESFVDGEFTPTSTEGYFVATPQNEFGQQIQTIEKEYNVSVNVRYRPVETDTTPAQGGQTPGNSSYYLRNGVPYGETITLSTSVTLYGVDRLETTSSAHSHRVSPVVSSSGDGDRLRSLSSGDYPIPERPGGSGEVYNTVKIEVVIWHE